jgi:hypothetical protein
LLCFNEGMQKRYRFQDRHSSGSDSPFTHTPHTAEEWAELVAATSVRALLRRPTEMARIQRQAAAYYDA